MNTPWEIITLLLSDNSRLYKENIIRQEAIANNIEFFNGVNLALNSFITFGVKQIPTANKDGAGLKWNEFKEVCDKLAIRELSGNDARDAIIELMNQSTVMEWNGWYRLILLKDLKCGVSLKTVNNIVEKEFPQFIIPVFTVQLAKNFVDYERKIKGKHLVSSKIDGIRNPIIVYPNGLVESFSRTGKILTNFPHITDELSKGILFDEPMVLDGECSSSSFQDLMKQVHRKQDVNATDAILYLFDILPLKDFNNGICYTTQQERINILETWYNKNSFTNIKLLENVLIDFDTIAGRANFNALNQLALLNDYEGLMIKDPNAPYELKRSTAWLKLKPRITVDLTIREVKKGTGKNKNRMGALECEGIEDDKFIRASIGYGFTDTERDELWESRNKIIGQIIEVSADCITFNQNEGYSLRFPSFKRFRGFTPGEKL